MKLLVLLVGVFTLQASSQTLPCQVTGGTSCPTMICPNTTVNYTCNVGSFAGNTVWNVPSVGGCSGSPLTLAQGTPALGLSCLNSSSSATCGPFTVTNTPPLTSNVYCLTSTLSVMVTLAMNGLVVSCSNFSTTTFTTTPVGNAAISVVVPPSAPNITSLISMYSDRLTVTWTSNSTATSYNVSINDSVNTLVPIPSTGASQYMWSFTRLTNNTVYTVSVVAINCAGSSSPATMSNRTSNGTTAPTTTSPTPTPTSASKTTPSSSYIAIGVGIGVGVGVPVLLALILVIVGVVYCTTRGGNKSLKIRNEESSPDGSHPPPSKPPRVKNSSPPAAEAPKSAAKPSGEGLVYADVNTAKGSGNKRSAPPPANDGVTYSGVKH